MTQGKGSRERDKEDKRRGIMWAAFQVLVSPWMCRKFNFSYADFDPSAIEGPLLVAINHSCAYDPIFAGIAFRKKRLTFVASEHILRSKWGDLLDKCVSIIPHQKGARGSRTALVAMKKIKRGESVFLAVEGEQTWNGRPMPVMPYTGKLVKGSKATLVTYMIEGAYLSAPRWSFSTRRGKVYGHPVNVYSPELLQGMSDEEVEAAIAKDLAFDIWEWQKNRPGGPARYKCVKGGNADGLERSVFTCPECGRMEELKSSGDEISCSCGFSVRMNDSGFFDAPAPFETVCEWEDIDRKALSEHMESLRQAGDDAELFSDDKVTLVRIEDGHAEKEIAHDRLTLVYNNEDFVMEIGEYRFSLKQISNMTMILAARVVFSDKSGYYELRSAKGSRTNLRKYVIAREIMIGE